MTVEHSCGAVVFTVVGGERRYVIIRSREGISGFPKGHIEAGESERECALREICEDTGLKVTLLEGFRTETSHPFKKHGEERIKHVVFFLAEYEGQEPRAQESEVAAVSLLSYEEALTALQYEDARAVLREAHAYRFERR